MEEFGMKDKDCIFCKIANGEIPSATIYEKVAARVLPLAAKIGAAMKEALGCAGFNLVQNNGAEAGQTVFHFHVHVIPRYAGGPEMVTWEPGKMASEELAETAARIEAAL